MTQRTDRVDELLRQEIGSLLAREVADPRIGFATITDVETTPDLRHAKVWVSVIGTEAEQQAAVAALAHAVPFIRHELGVRLRIKRIPDLHVRLDDTSERGTRVLRLLDEIESGAGGGSPPDDATPLPTPVARLPHEGDAPEPAPPPVVPKPGPRRRPRRQPAGDRGPGRRRDHRDRP
ncbi:MAG: 30S ribosome-binding factor RbfA [Chloroflexi bacterium]|nr:30S ribosome-binding factor RbfA [Chloroflexota bacterium]